MAFKLYWVDHLLFAAYLILFSWLVTRVRFFQNSGLTSAQLIIIFLIKVIVGIFYGWIGVYYGEMAQMVDTWSFHYESVKAYQVLKTNPGQFLPSLFTNNYNGFGNFLSSYNSWWNDLHNNFFTMVLAIFHLLSFENYYTNVIFFSFLTLFGPIALYRIMIDVFPAKKGLVLFTTFLLPSFLYWSSGIHKDGLVFLSFMLVIYNFYFGLKQKRFSISKIIFIVLGLLLLLAIRNYLLLLLLPALLTWAISEKIKRPTLVFTIAYLLFIACFFSASTFRSELNFPAAVVKKQQDFHRLTGGSFVQTKELKPTIASFGQNLPEAVVLSAIRPFPKDVTHLLSFAASLEINLCVLGFAIFLLWHTKPTKNSSFLLFCVFFSFSVLLAIGFTVNFLGAIVRYRSIVLPFLIIPMIATIDWKKLRNTFKTLQLN